MANGGKDEECSALDNNGKLIVGARGQDGSAKLPVTRGKVSIHSHRLIVKKDDDNNLIFFTPDMPSTKANTGYENCDETTFRGFDLNIIVGQLHPDEYGNREPVMCFFGPVVKDGQKPIGMLSISDAAKIINHK